MAVYTILLLLGCAAYIYVYMCMFTPLGIKMGT